MGNVQARIDYIFYVACVAAPLSVIGSLLTLLTIYRSKQHISTYHRLVTGIAAYDIMLSISLSFGPFLLPAETGLPGAKGTTATCAAQGFFTYLGTLSFAYSAMLMWYYVAVIRYSVTEAFLAKWIEPWMHIVPTTYYLVTAFLGLRWKVLGPATPICLVGATPIGCADDDGGIDCDRGGERVHLFGLWLATVPYMVWNCLIVLALLIVAVTVLQRYCQSQRFDFEATAHRKNNNRGLERKQSTSKMKQETNQVLIQCFLYAIVFTNVMVWTTLGTILYLRGIDYDILTDPLFGIAALSLFFFPIQGFFLFLIFLRPRYRNMREHHGRRQSVVKAIWHPSEGRSGSRKTSSQQRNVSKPSVGGNSVGNGQPSDEGLHVPQECAPVATDILSPIPPPKDYDDQDHSQYVMGP
jgi:hypothetical protein